VPVPTNNWARSAKKYQGPYCAGAMANRPKTALCLYEGAGGKLFLLGLKAEGCVQDEGYQECQGKRLLCREEGAWGFIIKRKVSMKRGGGQP